jgi:serine/threonine protein kinase/Tol biopolymer transport system component
VETQPALERIAHFRIVGKVGAGGMGIVFRARDEQLGRTVAVKVLPPAFTADADRRARFMREARTAATVIHPNVAVIYEVGDDRGMVYIAMEWVDGRTLRETLDGQVMPLPEAVQIGLEIARGLSCAHHAGIVHRDLKPDNVMIARSGQVKILDFGLAKLLSVSSAGDPMMPTQPQLTRGVPPMGTPRYMSPEQARGVEVDQRSDLFSFGATLYEMVGGRSPFQGDTDMDLVVAVISMRPPPLSVPPELGRIIDRCLEKEPDRRYQTCAEMIDDLEAFRRSLQTTSSLAPPPVAPPAVRSRAPSRRGIAAIAGVAAVVAVSAGALYQRFDRGQPPPPVAGPAKVERLTSHSIEANIYTGSLSPDGRYLAYITERGISRVLSVATGDEMPLALPKGGIDIDWAVDSAHVFVTTESQRFTSIWVAPIAPNQSAIKLLDRGHFPQAAPDGKRFAYIGPGGLTIRNITGEGQRSIVPLPASAFDGLAWSPGGKRIAFVTSDGKDASTIKLETVLVEGGPPQQVPEATNLYAIRGGIAWLADGRIVYAGTAPGGALRAVWVDENTGEAGGPSVAVIAEDFPAQELSPTSDGKRLAFKRVDTQSDAYVAAIDQESVVPRRLTLQDDDDRPLQWTNDSREVLFEARRRGSFAIFRQQTESAEPTRVRAVAAVESLRLTPDGTAFFGVRKTAAGWNLLRLPLGPGEETVLRKLDGPAEPSVRCARAPITVCFLGLQEEEQVRLRRLDERGQVSGPTVELPGFFRSRSWDLSPAGDRVAAVLEDHTITVVRLADETSQELAIGPPCKPEDIAWEPSGKSVIITCDGPRLEHRLYRVHLDGRVRLLWTASPSALELPSVSPDGRSVTLRVWTYDPDFWLLSAF